jgi:chemotaxis protein MotA
MDFTNLLDPASAAIVLGGTITATVLGSGRRELSATARCLGHLIARPFRYETARAEIARDVEAMRTDGLVRARPLRSRDSEIAQVSDALIHDRSLISLAEAHERFRQQRAAMREAALRPLCLAAEMGPVFGMAGTLVSLSQMQLGSAQGSMLAGIAMAVLTTLYGLLLAHLLCNPLARLVTRRGEQEEAERQRLIDWLSQQVAAACPPQARDGGTPRLERVV